MKSLSAILAVLVAMCVVSCSSESDSEGQAQSGTRTSAKTRAQAGTETGSAVDLSLEALVGVWEQRVTFGSETTAMGRIEYRADGTQIAHSPSGKATHMRYEVIEPDVIRTHYSHGKFTSDVRVVSLSHDELVYEDIKRPGLHMSFYRVAGE